MTAKETERKCERCLQAMKYTLVVHAIYNLCDFSSPEHTYDAGIEK